VLPFFYSLRLFAYLSKFAARNGRRTRLFFPDSLQPARSLRFFFFFETRPAGARKVGRSISGRRSSTTLALTCPLFAVGAFFFPYAPIKRRNSRDVQGLPVGALSEPPLEIGSIFPFPLAPPVRDAVRPDFLRHFREQALKHALVYYSSELCS